MDRLLNLKSKHGARKKTKVVGRGNGSGHGSYSTRGGKGQTARSGSGYKPGFEGGQTPLYRRMPKLKGFNNPNHVSFQVINLDTLNIFEDGTEVDAAKMFEKSLIRSKNKPVKVLGNGELTKKLHIKADNFSKSAVEKLEKSKSTFTQLMKAETKPETVEPKKAAKTK